jgi:hypothetical protein
VPASLSLWFFFPLPVLFTALFVTMDASEFVPDVYHEPGWLSASECRQLEKQFLTTVPLFRPRYHSKQHENDCSTPCYCFFYANGVHGGMPEWLELLARRVEQRLKNLEPGYFNCALCRLYQDGTDQISWHTDLRRNNDEEELVIGSVSLGPQARFFHMRRVWNIWSKKKQGEEGAKKVAPRKTWKKWNLTRGDLFAMVGRRSQANFEHAVIPEKEATSWRININFRHIREDHYKEGCMRHYRYCVYGDEHPYAQSHMNADFIHETIKSKPELFPRQWTYGENIASVQQQRNEPSKSKVQANLLSMFKPLE